MIKYYKDLSDEQLSNLFYLLDKSNTHELYKMKQNFQIKLGKNLIEARSNVVHGLMMEEIDFNFFYKWLCHIYLEANNTLYIFEPEKQNFFTNHKKRDIYKKFHSKCENLYNINVDTISSVALVDVTEYETQLLFTFAAPSYVIKQKLNADTPADIVKDIYLSYLVMDYETEQVILSMHPTNNLYSLNGIKKKKDMDPLALQFINYFRNNIIDFSFSNPEWIIDALFDITEEYFDHNNPIISKKMNDFKEKGYLNTTIETIGKLEETFKNNPTRLRLEKALMELYESQLIAKYGTIPKETPFKVFLNEADKGITSFKADSRGKALSFADSYEIVKKMMENADIASLGITYVYNGREFPYKIVKEVAYYSLKRITTAATEKETVDNVLRQLKQYKPRKKVRDITG